MVRREAERDEVERPFIEQLKSMGWRHVHGPDLAGPQDERAPGDVLLAKRLKSALKRVNRVRGTGEQWMSEADADSALDALRRTARSVGSRQLKDVNGHVTSLLLSGTQMIGHEVHHQGKDVLAQYIDWDMEGLDDAEILARNEFLVVDQLRVRPPGGGKDAVLDLVLFVNGIPVTVVECKSPDLKDPIGDGIRDLRAYAGVPLDSDDRSPDARPVGVPELFAPVQLLVAASGESAALGTITSDEDHFAPWRSVTPDYEDSKELLRTLQATRTDAGKRLLADGQELTDQHKLVAIVLKPRNLLNIVRHYVFEMPVKTKEGEPARTVKAVCRHQQYRAVEKIVRKLRTGRTLLDPAAEQDERGGVIWHTQGSGKSLTMAFLARRLQTSRDPELNRFTILVVTDRRQLEKQLSAALRSSGSTIRIARSQTDVEGMLSRAGKPGGRAVVFAMIQKYLGRVPGLVGQGADDERDLSDEFAEAQERLAEVGGEQEAGDPVPAEDVIEEIRRRFTECSTSEHVLVLVDEAHRSHSSVLHACLRDAVPNAARIGFTGTPIMKGRLSDTGRIFGLEPDNKFLDAYLMGEAERDKVVVPVRYEGRTGPAEIRDKEGADRKFDELIEEADRKAQERAEDDETAQESDGDPGPDSEGLGGQRDRQFEDLVARLRAEGRARLRRSLTPTARDVAESAPLIRAKAVDMLEHYVTGPLTGGFKAQVAAVSRRATVTYAAMLSDARAELLGRVREFDPETLRHKSLAQYSRDELVLLRAWQYQEVLRRIEFVPVISAGEEQKSGAWTQWTDPRRQEEHVERFLEPLPELPPDNPWIVEHTPEPDPLPGGMVGLNPWSDDEADAGAETAAGREKPPIAFLIVKSMLLTGFDAPIEQVLYLDRPIQDAELLQAIARVNRPRTAKREGLVVDYYGVLNNLAVTLPAYRGDGPALSAVRSLESEVPEMRRTAADLEEYLTGLGITGLDTPGGIARGMLALANDGERAEFDRKLGEFMSAVERVLPHQAALRHVPNARHWVALQRRVRRHYRDAQGGDFSMRAYGRKVRAMVADHLDLPELQQVIAPVSLLDPDFDEAVGRITDVRESAAEQVQALRYHLEERQEREQRPVYRTLSQELERILEECEDRWEEIKERVGPLIDRARKAEEADPAVADLTPVEQAIYTKLVEYMEERPVFVPPEAELLRTLTVEVAAIIARHVNRASWSADESSSVDLGVDLYGCLRDGGLRTTSGYGRQSIEDLSNALTGFTRSHEASFKAYGRGQ